MFSKNNIGPIIAKSNFLSTLPKLIEKYKELPFLPFYHAFGSSEELPHISHLYQAKNVSDFEKDLDVLLKYFKAISLEDLISYTKGQTEFSKPFMHLSFDDGLRQVYDLALPVLERKGIPATLFINSDFIDNKALFFRYKVSLLLGNIKDEDIRERLLSIDQKEDSLILEFAAKYDIDFKAFLNDYQPYMNSKQILDAQKRGFSLGAHSVDHPYYHKLKLNEQLEQTSDSLKSIQEKFGVATKSFAFPFSDVGVKNEFFNHNQIIESLDISFGTSGVKKDPIPFHFQRTCMEKGEMNAEEILKSEYSYYNFAKKLGWHQRKRK